MPNDDTSKKVSASPAQLAVVGVLSLVLIGAIYWNFVRSAPQSATAPRESQATRRQRGPAPAGEPVTEQSVEMQRLASRLKWKSKPWPEFGLADVAQFDPFAAPPAFPRLASTDGSRGRGDSETSDSDEAARQAQLAAERAAAIDAIREKGVQVVLRSENEVVAVIGDREIRVGDNVEGFTVVHIDATGVTLDRKNVQ